jgi:hypothetical protein
MKNITLSADEHLIEQARQVARSKHKTLNQEFRDWLQTYIRPTNPTEDFDELMKRVSYVRIGRKFTREEMNER